MKMKTFQSDYDEINRLKKKLKVMEHHKRPKYFGDQYLIMHDFFDELNDEYRYLYFGGMLSDNKVNIMYGRLGPISQSMTMVLDQYLMSKIALAKAGKDIEDQMLRPTKHHDIEHIYS